MLCLLQYKDFAYNILAKMEDSTKFQFLKGYENLYKINCNGDVWSCIYQKVMKPQLSKDGYLWVKLTKEKVNHKGRIHRLLGLQ